MCYHPFKNPKQPAGFFRATLVPVTAAPDTHLEALWRATTVDHPPFRVPAVIAPPAHPHPKMVGKICFSPLEDSPLERSTRCSIAIFSPITQWSTWAVHHEQLCMGVAIRYVYSPVDNSKQLIAIHQADPRWSFDAPMICGNSCHQSTKKTIQVEGNSWSPSNLFYRLRVWWVFEKNIPLYEVMIW